jgi:hypothetical protein
VVVRWPRLGDGWHFPCRPDVLTTEEWESLATQLYGLLRQFRGYRAAIVGWDPEYLGDLGDLAVEWREDDDIYRLAGLVVADDLAAAWALDDRFVTFAAGYNWLPRVTPPPLSMGYR